MKKSKAVIENRNIEAKSYTIEFYRWLMMIPVCIHHFNFYAKYSMTGSYPFNGGYLSVEFFFILSGFFLMHHYTKKVTLSERQSPEKSAVKYFLNRYKRFFPTYIFSFLMIALLYTVIWKQITVKQVMCQNFWEMSMLQMGGMDNKLPINPVDWYVSALLIASFVIYWLLLKNENKYIYLFAPLSLLLIYGYLFHTYGDLIAIDQFKFFLCVGLLRAFAEVGLGCICYKIHLLLKPVLTKKCSILSTLFEIICLLFVFKTLCTDCHSSIDYIIAVVMALLVISISVGNSYLSSLFNNKFSAYLGKISFAIYLNQMFIIYIIDHYFKGYSFWPMTVCYLLILMLYSMFTTWFVDKLAKGIKRLFGRLITVKNG